jgi:hypothetical protein
MQEVLSETIKEMRKERQKDQLRKELLHLSDLARYADPVTKTLLDIRRNDIIAQLS